MKKVLCILGIIAGIALGVYVGIWLMLIGGIVGVVGFIQGMIDGNTDGMLLAISIVKILFAGFAGIVSAYVLIIPSLLALGYSNGKYKPLKYKK